MNLPIEIQANRNWLWWFFALGIALFLLGLAFFLIPHSMQSPLMQHDIAIRLIGLLILLGSGLFLRQLILRLKAQRPGLVIERSGLIDNSSTLSVGWIDWADVTGIREARIANVNVLILDTSHSEKYIKRAKTELAKSARRVHQKIHGSPIAVTGSALQISYQKLERLLRETFKAYKQRAEE